MLLMQAAAVSVFAQDKPKAGDIISGFVDDDYGPLMMTTVNERDAADRIVAHCITANDGSFSFKLVNPKDRLVITYVGYEKVDIPIDTTYYEIKMKDQGDLMPVVVLDADGDPSRPPIPLREISPLVKTIDIDSFMASALATLIPPKVYDVNMSNSSLVLPNEWLNMDIPGVEFQVDNNGLRHIVSLPEQCYTDNENGHGYVDMGLSVKWATCNIGADSPEKTGGRYAWGEVATKPDYTWLNYRFNGGDDGFWNVKMSKYNTDRNLGPVDNLEVLEPEDDAAHVNWGGKWRIPTAEEIQELTANCTFVWSALNGCEGYLIVSNKPGYTDRFIFLPATRIRNDGIGSDGYYWSSTLNPIERQGSYNPGPSNCYALHIMKISLFSVMIDLENCRCWGLAIRPVCP
jgi:hypothetical protein